MSISPAALSRMAWWTALAATSVVLVGISPIFAPAGSFSLIEMAWASHLFILLMVWAWIWHGLWWGIGAVSWACALVGLVGLAARDSGLLWLPVEFVGLAFILQAGMRRWKEILSAGLIHEERLQEGINTLEDELHHLEDSSQGLQERLKRYQKLRQVANTFSVSLSIEDLIQRIVEAAGQVIERADLVILFLVEPQALTLELKSVWRRAGSLTIKAKTGDPIDLWVMRQAQPLLVEEPKSDFRFPPPVLEQLERPIGALLAVPLVSEYRFLGVLRVESVRSNGLGPEDLRLARIVGDLASLGLSNSFLYSRMLDLAITDDLTGLVVRRHFEKRLAEELVRAERQRSALSLLLIDIDRFKDYNDTFGHSAGDKLLKHLAALLLRMQRPGEVSVRYGGEEFICLLPGMGLKEAAQRAELIREQVERSELELRRAPTQSTVSIGVAAFPSDGQAADALLKAADERLYRAKGLGRNRVCSA